MASRSAKSNAKKPKLVRDSFSIPKDEFAAIDVLKTRAIALGTSVKKSELLRAGLMALQGLGDAAFKAALAAVPTLKTGRPAAEPPPMPAAEKPVKAAAKTGDQAATKTATKTAAKTARKPAPPKPQAPVRPAPASAPAKAAGRKTAAAPRRNAARRAA